MKLCLICSTPLKFIKFKSSDGFVCKKCYEIVSLNFSQIIKHKTSEELKDLYELQNKSAHYNFEITRKINQLILFDDVNQQICLPNHAKYSNEQIKPEIFSFSVIGDCKIKETVVLKKERKVTKELGTIKVILQLNEQPSLKRVIYLIKTPIQTDSNAYSTMRILAEKMVQEIEQAKKGVSL